MRKILRKVDKLWVRNALKSRKKTQIQLADALKLDPSAITLLLNGTRKLQTHEIGEVAKFLNVPIMDVMKAFGVEITDSANSGFSGIEIVGSLDDTGMVSLSKKPLGMLPPILDNGDNLKALRFQTSMTGLELVDGWTVVYRETSGISALELGGLYIIRTDSEEVLLRWVRKGYEVGQFRFLWLTPEMETGQLVDASPVISVLTAT